MKPSVPLFRTHQSHARPPIGRFAVIMLTLIVLMLGLMSLSVSARTLLQTDRACTLTLSYAHNETPFPNQTVSLRKVADFTTDGRFVPLATYGDSLPDLNAVSSQTEWREIAVTLDTRVLAESIPADVTAVTDAAGNASFSAMTPGLYLVNGMQVEIEGGYCRFAPFVINLPGLAEDDTWNYDVRAIPKYTFYEITSDPVEYTVVKLWKDSGFEENRPDYVEVDIYRNQELAETVKLSEENGWQYRWTAPDDGSVWHTAERQVPEDYFVLVETNGNTFMITNVKSSDPPPPPPTGDSTHFYMIVLLLSFFGAILVLGGFSRRSKR